MFVYLLTTGDGSDGNEWGVLGIYSTREKAEEAQTAYEKPRVNAYGHTYTNKAKVEKWGVDDPF